MAGETRLRRGTYAELWEQAGEDMGVYLLLLRDWGLIPAMFAGPAGSRPAQPQGEGDRGETEAAGPPRHPQAGEDEGSPGDN